jgi:hypothetical protein
MGIRPPSAQNKKSKPAGSLETLHEPQQNPKPAAKPHKNIQPLQLSNLQPIHKPNEQPNPKRSSKPKKPMNIPGGAISKPKQLKQHQ